MKKQAKLSLTELKKNAASILGKDELMAFRGGIGENCTYNGVAGKVYACYDFSGQIPGSFTYYYLGTACSSSYCYASTAVGITQDCRNQGYPTTRLVKCCDTCTL